MGDNQMVSACEHNWRLVVDGPDCDVCQYSAVVGMARCVECGAVAGPLAIEEVLNGERQAMRIDPSPPKERVR